MAKTYTPLSQTKEKIAKCSAMLPNKLQCWRAGDVLVTEVTQTPASTDATGKAIAATEQVSQYQLCNFHAAMEQNDAAAKAKADADLAAAQKEEAAAATPKK